MKKMMMIFAMFLMAALPVSFSLAQAYGKTQAQRDAEFCASGVKMKLNQKQTDYAKEIGVLDKINKINSACDLRTDGACDATLSAMNEVGDGINADHRAWESDITPITMLGIRYTFARAALCEWNNK